MTLTVLTLLQQFVLLLAALVLFLSFVLLAQPRLIAAIHLFAWQGALIAAVTLTVALAGHAHHLYFSALLTLVLKALLIPWMLHRLVRRLGLERHTEALRWPALAMMAGVALVIFSYWLVVPMVEQGLAFTRNIVAVSLAVVLIGLLMMVLRQQAVARYAKTAVEPSRPELLTALTASAQRAIDLFAGADPVLATMSSGPVPLAGLQAVSQFMEGNVPEGERERAGEVLVRILNGVLFELNQVAREKQGLKPSPQDDATRAFMTQSVLSLSDSFFYRAPMTFMLEDFKQVQASVFQVSKAPGKTIVYLGCLFLIVGVFAMLYVRERRVWVWLAPHAQLGDESGAATGTQATLALSTNRKTMEVDKEFTQLKSRLLLLSS